MYLSLLVCWLLSFVPPQAPPSVSAVVNSSSATFTIQIKPHDRWTWCRADTRDNMMEYRIDVTVKNAGDEYTFGFYLWKRPGSSPGSGSFNDLLAKGQKSLFQRSESRLMTTVRDAEVKVKTKEDKVVISLHSKKDLQRLFSSKPTEVVIKTKIPGEPESSQTVSITYQ